jgi:hypothetical protein
MNTRRESDQKRSIREAPSSSGPGHRPLKAEIAGSNPAGATQHRAGSPPHDNARPFGQSCTLDREPVQREHDDERAPVVRPAPKGDAHLHEQQVSLLDDCPKGAAVTERHVRIREEIAIEFAHIHIVSVSRVRCNGRQQIG